jgi:serine/threonine protein phosphatase 1
MNTKARTTVTHPLSSTAPASLPAGMRIYAIGDVHGRDDLLADRHDQIRADLTALPVDNAVVIHLGDYIDRGPSSPAVIDRLIALDEFPARCICLFGNHEDEFLGFFEDPEHWSYWWYRYGGLDTLEAYGIDREFARVNPPTVVRDRLADAVPERHFAFLYSLSHWAQFGDYFFAHAGVKPGIPLSQQDEHDLIWIRDPFLNSQQDFGAVVVHGHTPGEGVVVRKNRIGIDTLAYSSNNLTCLVLEGSDRRIL